MLAVRRALALGAHPDDVELQAGGTLATWTRQGVHVELACFTAGEKGSSDPDADPAELGRVRRAEAEAAAGALGAAVPVHFLGAVDGELEATMALRLAVARLVRTVRPDVVVGHDPWRRWLLHPDHRAAGLLTVDGVVAARDPLYAPELAAEGLAAHRPHTVLLFGTDAPDEWVDVTAAMDAKLAAVAAHGSQVGDLTTFAQYRDGRSDRRSQTVGHGIAQTSLTDLERRVRTWNAAIGAEQRLRYAEAFHTLDTRGR